MTVTSISYVVPLESTPVIITVPSLIPIIFPFSIFAIDESSTVQVTLLKSRSSAAGNSVNLIFDFDHGFDRDLSMFQLLKEKGYVQGAGAYLYFKDHQEVKFAQKNFKDKLYENMELQEIFAEVTYECLTEMINKPRDIEQEKENTFNLASAIYNMNKRIA